MNWFETEEEKKARLEKASKTLSTGKASKKEKDKMTEKEIEDFAERKRKKNEEKTGNKGETYKHKPNKQLPKMQVYINEHNARLKAKEEAKKDSGLFSLIKDAFKKDDKKDKKK